LSPVEGGDEALLTRVPLRLMTVIPAIANHTPSNNGQPSDFAIAAGVKNAERDRIAANRRDRRAQTEFPF